MRLDEATVEQAARQLGLEPDPARRRAVLGNLQRIAELARPVLELELGPQDEAGPPWTP
jgi:hypothetical protein